MEEIQRIMERLVTTPHKPHEESKLGERNPIRKKEEKLVVQSANG